VCAMPNDVPPDYFSALDMATGRRLDERERPELSTGCVEYIAPQEYMVRRTDRWTDAEPELRRETDGGTEGQTEKWMDSLHG
jgi:hypothetical protein